MTSVIVVPVLLKIQTSGDKKLMVLVTATDLVREKKNNDSTSALLMEHYGKRRTL
jgi:hypothetical protein